MSQVVAVGLGAPVAEPTVTLYAPIFPRRKVKEQGWSNGWTPVDQNRFLVTMHGLADDKRTQPKAIKKRDPVTGKTRFEPTFLLMKEES